MRNVDVYVMLAAAVVFVGLIVGSVWMLAWLL